MHIALTCSLQFRCRWDLNMAVKMLWHCMG